MRKSSQGGRRVSQPMRMAALDDLVGSTNRRTLDTRRGSAIPLPRGRRSSSETRDGRMSAVAPTMKRSKSQLNILVTPAHSVITPIQGVSTGPYGSTQSQRFLSPYSESSRKSVYSGTGKTGRVVKDTRPLSDKSFQQREIQKVTSFLHMQPDALTFAPKGINLKQLTMKLFVDLVNYLMGFMDGNVNVNMTNYVNEIPLIAKRWGYVGNVNTSWLKTVNTPHAFPHVLGLLSWLTTLASAVSSTNYEAVVQDALVNSEDSADDDSFPYGNAVVYVQHLFKQYRLWNAKDEVAEENEERRFIQELCNRNGVSDEELREIAESVHTLEAQLNDPKEKAEVEAALEDEKKFNMFMNDYKSNLQYKVQMEEFLNSAETLLEEEKLKLEKDEDAVRNLHENIMELKKQLSQQVMTVDERDNLLRQCNELNSAIRENEEYIAVVSNQSYADDLEMAKKRSNIQKKTQAYNTIVIRDSSWLPELETLKIDTNFLHPGADQALAVIDSQAQDLKANLQEKREKLTGDITLLKEQILQLEERKSLLLQELNQSLEKVKEKEEIIETTKTRSVKEIEDMKKTVESLTSANQARITCCSLDTAKARLQALIEKREYGKAHIEKLKQKAESFFKETGAISNWFFNTVSEYEKEFALKRDNLLKKTNTNLERIKTEIDELTRTL